MRRLIVIPLVLLWLAGACGGGFSEAKAKDQIRTTWAVFYNGKDQNLPRKESLVEDGPQLHASLVKLLANPLAKQVTVRVDNVRLLSHTKATVDYTALLNGKALKLPGGKPLTVPAGVAVFVDGKWKVAVSTFCQVLGLAAIADPTLHAPTLCSK